MAQAVQVGVSAYINPKMFIWVDEFDPKAAPAGIVSGILVYGLSSPMLSEWTPKAIAEAINNAEIHNDSNRASRAEDAQESNTIRD